MIGFRTYLVHMTNLRNSIFLCYKIDNKNFCSSSYFTIQNSISNLDTHLKAQFTRSIGIVDSPLLKEHSNYISIINGSTQRNICQKKDECISICTPAHKGINKRLSHFGTSSLFVKNHFTIKNSCNVRQISSFSGQDGSLFTKNTGVFQHISESAPVEFVQDSFVWLHSYTGLPWWATIVLATIAVRATITLPLLAYQHYILAKLENLKYEMDDIIIHLKRNANRSVTELDWPEDFARNVYNREVKKHWKELIVKENCHPMKTLVLALVQFPLWVTLSFSLRNLCNMSPNYNHDAYQTYVELSTGGFGWMLNLTEADPFFIIPASVGLLNLIIIEVQTLTSIKERTRYQKVFVNFLRFLSIIIIPISAYIPSSICLYWMTSSACGLFQNLLLMSPKIRRLSRIPETERELSHPYRHLCEQIKNKYNFEVRSTK